MPEDGGAEGIRTPDPHNAIVVLYQLSYDPIFNRGRHNRSSSGTRQGIVGRQSGFLPIFETRTLRQTNDCNESGTIFAGAGLISCNQAQLLLQKNATGR